ncbi:hypothetical protein PDESU_02740 [Pontiella desulfatans]|uniref:Pectate lyase superfamily protein domain-containing protein n=1 Tax=Pontiella desulfatans TaxID=2750659 RepID=A0A6C2U3R0_PONDE|nr:DUF4955 domain-containing protein [Pontiella desulfatans]VGO14181.1 hypothetical protein PDESU_02740 [Pontiella desulfatans]
MTLKTLPLSLIALFFLASCGRQTQQDTTKAKPTPKPPTHPTEVPCTECKPAIAKPTAVEAPEQSYDENTLFGEYLAAQAKGERAKLPDFSHAGYHRCATPLPVVSETTHTYFDVTKFGGVPDDGKSDRDAAVAAFAAAHSHNGPAAIYFPEGNFRLFEKSDFGKPPLEIKRSNVVLKGSGVGTTQLEFAESHLPARPLILMRSSTGKDDYWRGDQKLKAMVKKQIGPFTVEVSDASELKPGMRINLNAQMDAHAESTKEFFCPHEVPSGWFERAKRKGGMLTDIFELHEIESIDDNTVRFGEPIHLDIPYYTNMAIYRIDGIIEECGIEDLSLRGGWRGQFNHHNSTRHGEDYRMVEMDRVFNSWVRRVRFTECSSAVSTWLCGFNTVSDLLIEGNTGHMAVVAKSSYGNLFAFMREESDVHHGFGVSRSGVNSVFYRCVQYKSMEAHCGYPRSTLFDLNEGGFQPRGGGATFFPMHDKGLTFWNWNVTLPDGSFDFWPEGQRYGYFLLPVVAGLHGEPFEIPDIETDLLAYESPGQKTVPESLFDAQLEHRLGQVPAWLAEAAAEFETVSRHSRIRITSPANHSEHRSVIVKMALHEKMDPKQVGRIELYASDTGLFDGFLRVGEVDPQTMEKEFKTKRPGVWVLKAKLTNRRGEIAFSKPITLYTGDPDKPKALGVSRSAMMPGKEKNTLYGEFVQQGGGEAQALKDSKVLASRKEGQPAHELEAAYRKELHAFYAAYGTSTFKDALDEQFAEVFFDGKTDVAGSKLYSYQDSLVQAAFSSTKKINRLDIHWRNGVPDKEVRLELQTSEDPGAWLSFVNDDLLWNPSALRIGGTLTGGPFPGSGKVSTLYFPAREAKFVRLLLSSFPDDVTEFRFFGD